MMAIKDVRRQHAQNVSLQTPDSGSMRWIMLSRVRCSDCSDALILASPNTFSEELFLFEPLPRPRLSPGATTYIAVELTYGILVIWFIVWVKPIKKSQDDF